MLARSESEAVAEAVQLAGRLSDPAVLDRCAEALERTAPHARGDGRRTILEALADCLLSCGRRPEALNVLNALRTDKGLDARGRIRVAAKQAGALAELGRHAEARTILREQVDACRTPGRLGPELAEAHLPLGVCDVGEGRPSEAERRFEEAHELAVRADRKDIASRALSQVAALRRNQGDYAGAHDLLESACSLATEAEDDAETAHAQMELGFIQLLRGEGEAARANLQASLAALRAAGRLGSAAAVLLRMGALSQRMSQWDEAIEQYAEGLRLAEVSGESELQAILLVNMSQVKATVGWLEPATDYARSALAASATPHTRCVALNRLGRVQLALGRLSEAYDCFTENVCIAEENGFNVLLETGERMAAAVAMAEGRLPEAGERLERALSICRQGLGDLRTAVCLVRVVELAIARDDAAAALDAAEEACRAVESQQNEQMKARARLGRAMARLFAGDPEAAIEELHAARDALAPAAVWDDLAEVEYFLGQAYASAGQLRFASVYYRNALDTVEQVARRLRHRENYEAFLAAPPQRRLFEAVAELRADLDGSQIEV
jgi:tetratricopeptide (TPR) repeat protein